MRILITGSRRWDDRLAVDHAIGRARAQSGDHLVVVHGGCPTGADAAADVYARAAGLELEVHEPDPTYGPQRFRIRNQAMVNAGADLCLTFANSWASGTGMCARMARAAGIRTVDYGVPTEAR
ncbi:MAG: DUF2493 domain-containing protein [Gemmatimonadota bacterium]|nr:DUF2493 domain-containing protein [Gemmatimonadota bacterium]